MTPHIIDVDSLFLDLARARHLIELVGFALGDACGTDEDPEVYCQVEALCHAAVARLRDIEARAENAPRAPREAAALLDPEWYGGEVEPD